MSTDKIISSSSENQKDIKKRVRVSRLISDLVSPPLVFALLGFSVALHALPSWRGLFWGAVYGFFICLLPVLVVIYMYKTGQVKDLHISDTRQRRIPYLVGVTGAIITYLLIVWWDGPDMLGVLALSNVIGLGVLGIINQFWLISNHMASITSAVLIAGLDFGLPISVILSPLVGLVFYARCVLHRHTIAQLVAGTAVGVATIGFMYQVGWL